MTKNNSVAVLKAEKKALEKQMGAIVGAINALVGEKNNASKKGRPKGSKNKKKAEAIETEEAHQLDDTPQPRKSRAKKEEKQPVEA